jgi:hypothetical protein
MSLAPGAEKSSSSRGPQSNTSWTGVRRSKHRIPPRPDGTSWALVLFFSSRNTARWDKGPHDRRYTAFAEVRKTCGWITSHRQVSTWSSFSPRCTSAPSAPSAHWSPSRRIASIAIIAQYPLPHCHDYGLALSCLSGNVAPLIGPVLPRHANPQSHPAPIPGPELSPQFIYWDGLYSLFELPAPLRKGSLFCTIWTILSVPSTRRN